MDMETIYGVVKNALCSADCNCEPGDGTCEDWRDSMHRQEYLALAITRHISKTFSESEIHGTVETNAAVEMISMPVSEWRYALETFTIAGEAITILRKELDEIKREIRETVARKTSKD